MIVAEMATDYDLASDWLNSNASAFIPDNATWARVMKRPYCCAAFL